MIRKNSTEDGQVFMRLRNYVKEGQKLPMFGIGPFLIYGMIALNAAVILSSYYIFKSGIAEGIYAYYHEYRALQQLCILILQNEKTQFGLGTRKTYGILFDCAWLWEEYINTLVTSAFYHPMNKSKKGSQWLFSGGSGLIYPDFIGKEAENISITV